MARELTREEKAAIRRLVISMCANYDRECGCLPLDCECYMLGKCWTGAYCRYFREAVLPLDPALEAALLTEGRPRFSSPARSAAGPSLPMGGCPTAPRLAPGPSCGGKSGTICGKSGGDVWKIRPRKTR